MNSTSVNKTYSPVTSLKFGNQKTPTAIGEKQVFSMYPSPVKLTFVESLQKAGYQAAVWLSRIYHCFTR